MNPLQPIKEGYQEYFKGILGYGNNDITAMANKRLAVCYECPKRLTFLCGACGCPLAVKTRSISATCPLKKW